MTDLEKFLELAKKCGSAQVTSKRHPFGHNPATAKVVWVSPGYRSHTEAEFDASGNILSLGSFWEDNEMPDEADHA